MSEEELRKEMEEKMRLYQAQRNAAAVDDFRGLSPDQMHGLLYQPFQPPCVVEFAPAVPDGLVEEMPLIKLTLCLLDRLADGELKLTAKGNLPRKFVHELYDLRLYPQSLYDDGHFKLNRQDEFTPAVLVRYLPEIAGLTKVRKGKMSLTKKGREVYQGPHQDLFRELFLTYAFKFNFSFLHGEPEIPFLQQGLGFVLYLLHLDGKEWRPVELYAAAFLRAFPQVVYDIPGTPYSTPSKQYNDAFYYRLFWGVLEYFGLVRNRHDDFRGPPPEVMATDRFRKVFSFAN